MVAETLDALGEPGEPTEGVEGVPDYRLSLCETLRSIAETYAIMPPSETLSACTAIILLQTLAASSKTTAVVLLGILSTRGEIRRPKVIELSQSTGLAVRTIYREIAKIEQHPILGNLVLRKAKV